MNACGLHLFETPIGRCGIGWGARGIASVQLPDRNDARLLARLRLRLPDAPVAPPPAFVREAAERTLRLLQGERDDLLDVELDMEGVAPLHQRVYARARAIPPGRTITYGELAHDIGEPSAARAVGQALGLNPFAPIVPCHRILAAGARSGGFSAPGGVDTKLQMLLIERAAFGEPGLFD
ncbi:methylated-DNA--[protein]-cysteine S-methyltransferase [Pseudorhodoferax sp. Leaf267]|uniref:methylated-DNA--[protein]-cysteine S-methyltransferase n=1 Tax=Pseudorhodoferax sp. Leaf267 TaxID=1736316 RepID=UPI0006FE9754|nr:methylated-DNA--[protein]-cysteine S-methyltransferase [Pseudorhodoferax sp. Leaf267]KQP22053.1 cysteine methyltransferase [Pseudorhodoferax sp. Leaf267]